MRHLKQNLLLAFLTLTIGLSAQGNIDNQYFIYTSIPNTTTANSAVIATAALLHSNVVEISGPNQNLALLEWDGIPFTITNSTGTYTFNTMVDIMTEVKKKNTGGIPVETDGGTLNIIHNPNKIGGILGSTRKCYASNSAASQNGSDVTVGIFDTGLNYEDAQSVGYTFNSVTEIGNEGVTDTNGHGTHIGTIIDGVYHKYLPSDPLNYVIGSSFNDSGQSTLYDLVSSIEDGLHMGGIDIMNFSFTYEGGADQGDDQEDALFHLLNSDLAQNILFVCAAGNDSKDLDNGPGQPSSPYGINTYYPAAFRLPSILTVGSYICAGRSLKVKSSFSNYGLISADFAAPGESITGLNEKNEFVAMSGTSQATANVTAAAAVLKSAYPHFKGEEIKCLLLEYAALAPYLVNEFKYAKILSIDGFINNPNISCSEPTGQAGGSASSSTEVLETTTLFPNPVSDILNIQYNVAADSDVTFEVYTINGQLVSTLTEHTYKGNNSFTINFNNIVWNNQYVLRIISNDKIETRKISRF